jgi:hypothetical protein
MRRARPSTTNKAQVFDLGLRRGAGDGNRTRALSLGITVQVGPDYGLTCTHEAVRGLALAHA